LFAVFLACCICGKNNTGKTYTTYALFGFLDLKNEFLRITVPDASVEDLLHDGSTSIDLMHYAAGSQKIPSFSVNSFCALKISVSLNASNQPLDSFSTS
jgi:ABC-type branched-subunit amino acid transport system ATPase component